MNHHDADDRFAGLWQKLVILTQSAIAIEPPQRPLDNPTFGEHFEALGASGALDDLQVDRAMGPQCPHPVHERPSIGCVSPDPSQAGKLMPEALQQTFGSVSILHTGGRDRYGEDEPKRIDEEVSLAPFDLFVGIKPTEPPFSVVLTD